MTRAISADRIITCDPARSASDNVLGVVLDSAILIDGERIAAIVPRAELDPSLPCEDFGAFVITPGLVDAHTHAAWTGSRHDEYAIKMAGGDYRAIAAAGGGIASSQRALAAIPEADLADQIAARLERMASLGVTTCEVKSGYGLEKDHELKQLRVIARVANRRDLPKIVPTFLALHALPKSVSHRDNYVRAVGDLVDTVAAAALARFVDAYVDGNAFSVAEARPICERARAAGLGLRLHVGQFADVGGAELAAEFGARSADHLEHVSEEALARLASAHVAATLLPTASFTLRQEPPPVAAMRAHGLALVVASDANPGTAPSESLPLAMALAVRLYGLTAEEAILGATRHAAESLDSAAGVLRAGAPADLVVWDLPHERAIVQPWGCSKTRRVLRDGTAIFSVQT